MLQEVDADMSWARRRDIFDTSFVDELFMIISMLDWMMFVVGSMYVISASFSILSRMNA